MAAGRCLEFERTAPFGISIAHGQWELAPRNNAETGRLLGGVRSAAGGITRGRQCGGLLAYCRCDARLVPGRLLGLVIARRGVAGCVKCDLGAIAISTSLSPVPYPPVLPLLP